MVPQQMSISKWHQLTNYTSPRLIWHCAGSDRGLLLISAIPKPPEHLSRQQENSPFAILLPVFIKWFRSANKGSLGQLSLCLCAPDQCMGDKEMWLYWCLWHCISIVWSGNQFQLRKQFQYLQNRLDQNVFVLLIPVFDSQLLFFLFFLRKIYYFQFYNENCDCEVYFGAA